MFRKVKCALLIAVSLLVTKVAHSEADTIHARVVGQHGFMDTDWYVCPSWDVFQKFNKLLKDDAEAAFVLGDRDCIKVREETEVVVEDTNYFWGPAATCVRPIGSPDCGWVLVGYVTTALCQPVYVSIGQGLRCVARKEQDNPQRLWSAGYSGK